MITTEQRELMQKFIDKLNADQELVERALGTLSHEIDVLDAGKKYLPMGVIGKRLAVLEAASGQVMPKLNELLDDIAERSKLAPDVRRLLENPEEPEAPKAPEPQIKNTAREGSTLEAAKAIEAMVKSPSESEKPRAQKRRRDSSLSKAAAEIQKLDESDGE